MLPLRPPPSLVRSVRLMHTSSRTCNLVAPPDPVSHMRPIIYNDTPPPTPPTLLRHPYSLSEFENGSFELQTGENELQFKLQRQQLDAFHHDFWLDSNTRFEAAKEAVLASLPSSSTAIDKENALSEFYKHWYLQENQRTDEYTTEWRRRNLSLIILATRVEWQRFTASLSGLLTLKRSSV